jgi:ATP-dependent DNA helicase RecG
MRKNQPMNSLLQGDVGSGKTVIAVALSYAFAKQGIQSIILAPTTVLSKQHKQTFDRMLEFDNTVSTELVTSDKKNSDKADILIGTTALLARKADIIDEVGVLIVDEQHRFGVTQREEIVSEKKNTKTIPHFINMTATPIPRTIAEVFFSDVEVVSIKNKPIGRKEIKTHLFGMYKRSDAIKWIREIVKNGDQVYWICPLIEDGEVRPALSVMSLGKELKSKMKKVRIEILHGKIKADEKNRIMQAFSDGEIDVLISTTVIEVGIDVPNATVMVIENPEMFGLAQLHQLRGRVGRGEKQSYCFLSLNTEISVEAVNRLEYFTSTNDGLAIAEYDLSRRGPGEVYGTKQSGIPKLKIATLKNLEMIKKSRSLAEKAYNTGIKSINLFR